METQVKMNKLPVIPNTSSADRLNIFHCPNYMIKRETSAISLSDCESLLTEWFEQEVILLASGRSGLDLYLRSKKFNCYQHKLQVPKYLSRCVINALTYTVFPVEKPHNADGILLYHQYGFPQRRRPKDEFIIEDIAHAFFPSPLSGSRNWIGEAAVFSIPKFFATSGLAGGLVIRNKKYAKLIRTMLNEAPVAPLDVLEWMRQVYKSDSILQKNVFLGSMYELLFKYYRPDPLNLVGFPKNLEGIGLIGEQRRERTSFFLSCFGYDSFPKEFWRREETFLPFALPYFGSGRIEKMKKIQDLLAKERFYTDIYHIDINRNMYKPIYLPCLLLPCHQDIPMDVFKNICGIIRKNDN